MKSLFAQVRSHINDEDFQIITLTNDEITKCLHVFTTGQNVLSLTPVQQNSLLFILLSFQSKSLAPTLSSLCSSSMSLPNDLLRLNSIISILFSFPLPLYLMLLELSRTFGGIPAHPLRRKKVIELITEVIFREHQNIEFERNFISFILTFYRIIFRDTFLTDDTEFRTDSETLYITNSDKILYTFKGKSTTNYSDTNPFNPESIDIVTNLHTQFGKSTDNNKNIITNEIINNNFNLLNERIDKIHKLVNKYKLRNQLTFINNSIPSPQAFFQLDYDNYALSELPEQIMTEVSPIILEDNDDEFKVRSLDTALLEPKVSRPISNNKHLIPKPRVKINQTPIQSNNIFERSKTSDMFNSLRTTSSYVKLNNINNNIRNLRNRMNAKRDSLEAWSSELEFFSSENSNSLEMFNTMKSDVSGLNSLKLEEEDYDEEDEEELDEEDENVEKK
ncbi:hypothetical protein GPJ56_003039 [Histomonas meleagridis]|uniref:uncharacterized protein n=1 Tax=Histomonas meleagridis TaxID=135588 RepID=UPI00355A711B|nr:hypothetical protein GPJ56_003039 [Histomonas meleagridis]KAH0796695.1 hypothetical protein GO595_010588 [Histomonas meleagridis]